MTAATAQAPALQDVVDRCYGEFCGRDYMHLPLDEALRAAMAARAPAEPLSDERIASAEDFSDWLNARRDLPVAEVFHDVMAAYRAALGIEAAVRAQAPTDGEVKPEFAKFVDTPQKRFLYDWGRRDGFGDGYAKALDEVRAQAPTEPADDFASTEARIDEYIESYELRDSDEGADHAPTEFEKFLIKDAVMGMLAEPGIFGGGRAQAPSAEAGPTDLWPLIRAYAECRVDCDRSNGAVSQAYLKLAESNLRDALTPPAASPTQGEQS